MEQQVAAARALVSSASRVLVLTGAGISTDSGIADFRGPNGVWTKNPEAEKTSHLRYYLDDPEVRRAAWRNRLTSPIWSARPNAGHLALVSLWESGRLDTVVTQNIDGLHLAAGLPPEVVVEIHGNAHSVVCWSCGETAPMERALDRVRSGEDDPACRSCDGILKSTTVSFGQQLDPSDLSRAAAAGARADLLLAVGSTLSVYPAADLVPTALRRKIPVVIVNAEPTEFDPYVDVVVRGSISSVLPEIVRGGRPLPGSSDPA
ncbi:MAG: NAD-dependent deacetylase [Actinomycetota bacterium]|jgi:NAD-dependent deacetylase|nr:NAD-dependent deacetylase [Actinomycetota bacterium]